jgi:hypothetical protein
VPDFESYRAQRAAQLMVPEPKDFDALPGEVLVSFLIFGSLFGKTVTTTVQYDGEFCGWAIEIQIIDAAGVLAAEFEFVEVAAA